MVLFTESLILGQVERRLAEASASETEAQQHFVLVEAVMWLWMLDERFHASQHLAVDDAARLNGLYHARHKGLHEAMQVATMIDGHSDHYTNLYRSPAWGPLPEARPNEKNQRQENDYKLTLQGHLVLDTLQALVAALRRVWP